MDKTSGVLLGVGSALVGALVAPFLVGAIGYSACYLIAWTSGNPRYWDWMWLVYFLAICSAPVAFAAILITWARGLERRDRE